jgi:hypothetical protein
VLTAAVKTRPHYPGLLDRDEPPAGRTVRFTGPSTGRRPGVTAEPA